MYRKMVVWSCVEVPMQTELWKAFFCSAVVFRRGAAAAAAAATRKCPRLPLRTLSFCFRQRLIFILAFISPYSTSPHVCQTQTVRQFICWPSTILFITRSVLLQNTRVFCHKVSWRQQIQDDTKKREFWKPQQKLKKSKKKNWQKLNHYNLPFKRQ